MLVIPLPTSGLHELHVLITDNPAEACAAGVPAVTPDFAVVLRHRWHGARYAESYGERELILPLRIARGEAA
jgi:hypothetical protein